VGPHPHNGLAYPEAAIQVLKERPSFLAAVGCTNVENDGSAVFCRTAGTCGVATGERIVHTAALIQLGGNFGFRGSIAKYAER